MGRLAWLGVLVAALAAACGGDDDGGVDAGRPDAGPGIDAGSPPEDAGPGEGDAGGPIDAGERADGGGEDGGSPVEDGGGRRDGAISLACSVDELRPILECAADSCVDISLPDGGLLRDGGGLPDASLPSGGELAACILRNCAALLLRVSPECRDCLVAGVGMDVDEIRMRCAEGLPMP